MNNNILICLLFILIAYTIFKMLSNTCNGFSIGGVGGDKDQCPEYIQDISKCCDYEKNNCPNDFPYYCDKDCSESFDNFKINCSNISGIIRQMYDNIIDNSCKKTCSNKEIYDYETQSCIDPIDLKLKLGDTRQKLFDRLKKAYNDPTSNGVFISMIFNLDNHNVYLDGSGSIIRKDIDGYGRPMDIRCSFGFIWDIDYLDTNLISCLFPTDAMTIPFLPCIDNSYNALDFCKIANTSKDKETPDRCSKGLQYYFNFGKDNRPEDPDPTNCSQNIRYDMDEEPYRRPLNKDENCFKYIVDVFKKNKKTPLSLKLPFVKNSYNEGIFLKDTNSYELEIHKGLEELTRLNKPTPVALVYLYDNLCGLSDKIQLKALKLNFTPNTVVIRIYRDGQEHHLKKVKFVDYTTLDQMPGYNDV